MTPDAGALVPGTLRFVTGPVAAEIVRGDLSGCVEIVRLTYLAHADGSTVLPHSVFVRFPDRPDARIIALPGHLGAPWHVSGIKWIGSYPGNIARNLPRASAILVLNDHATGFPFACMEASVLSAARTAASATLAAEELFGERRRAHTVAFIGTGLIARAVYSFLLGTGWEMPHVVLHDIVGERASRFAERLSGARKHVLVEVAASAAEAVRCSDLVVLATVASSPHLVHPADFAHHPLVLHLSLRDLGPSVIAGAHNVVDDVEHVMRAGTSLELAERSMGHREFVTGTLADVLRGRTVARDRTVVFSPFGLGVLDIAVGKWVFDAALIKGQAPEVPDFFVADPW